MARPQLSKEYVNDSASEHDSSSSEEESEDETTLSKEPISVPRPNRAQQQSGEDSSASNSDVDSDESQSEESPKDPSPNDLKRRKTSQQTSSPTKKVKSAPPHIPSRAYQPPTGYLPVKSDGRSSVLGSMLSSNKEIWHLTMPASVPISKLKSFDLQAALRGKTILEHKGVKYHMHATPAQNDSLLLPLANPVSTGRGSEATVAYEPAAVPVSRALYLRELTSLPASSKPMHQVKSSSQENNISQAQDVESQTFNFFATQTGSKQQPRQQPKGLMMRYHPFGSKHSGKEVIRSTADDDIPEEEENVHEPPVNGVEMPAEVSDDDHMDVDVAPTVPSKSKSDKKKRKNKDRINKVTETPMKEKKSKKDKSHQSNGDTAMTNGDVRTDHQKERKETRKEKNRKKDKTSVQA